ncbi:MAG: phosphatidate cytidylyltransferase [Clostridiaceae bacterium]
MNNRYIGALLLAPFIIFIFLGGYFLKYGILALSLLGLYEFYKVVKTKDIHPLNIFSYTLCIIYYFFLNTDYSMTFVIPIIFIFVFVSFCIPIINTNYNFIDIAITILGFLYVPVMFSFIPSVEASKGGKYLVWFIFISAWLCDIFAYYFGKYLGNKKLCPKVSPKKTIVGSLGGILGSTLGCTLLGIYSNSQSLSIPIYNYILIGLLCGVFCQFGDLFASSIKRYVGVKDYSHLIPGHGGILDRFDSILFAGTVVYYYITFILVI